MRRERELAYKPLLVITTGYLDPPPAGVERIGFPPLAFVIRNIGTGPALNIAFCAQAFQGSPQELNWISAEYPGISAGAEEKVGMFYRRDPEPDRPRPDRYRCLIEGWPWLDDGVVFAVRYEDWFGTHYLSPGGPQMPSTAEWRGQRGTVDQPGWLRCS